MNKYKSAAVTSAATDQYVVSREPLMKGLDLWGGAPGRRVRQSSAGGHGAVQAVT